MSNKYESYTPENIASSNVRCLIPLYQRLFEWEEQQIEKLLIDLKSHYDKYKNDPTPYYIGMLTAHKKDGVYELVDGQQRFTVMVLMGIVFNWKDFLLCDNKLRLSFYARPDDEQYILSKINLRKPDCNYKNHRMERALNCINNFTKAIDQKEEFANLVRGNLTFFISNLPDSYQSVDMNKYFETMNSAGRALEHHEKLKVDLLKYSSSNKEINTQIWNVVEQMDRFVIKKSEGESMDEYRQKYTECIDYLRENVDCSKITQWLGRHNEDLDQKKIGQIAHSDKKPSDNSYQVDGSRSIVNFSEFLLLVLDIQLEGCGGYEFHRTDHLLNTFTKLPADKADRFYRDLLLYKLLLDYYIIRVQADHHRNSYSIEYSFDGKTDKQLIQYQSMLYVSTESYKWLKPMLVWLKSQVTVDSRSFLFKLKQIDIKNNELDIDKLYYPVVNRYWFWKLDYCLWEKEFLKEGVDQDQIILDYTFRTNRSIEHLHPQNQLENTHWKEEDIHSFGNLALISQSFNSSQGNSDVGVKLARVRSQIECKDLESIKMYKMYLAANEKSDIWSEELAKQHQEDMIALLLESIS